MMIGNKAKQTNGEEKHLLVCINLWKHNSDIFNVSLLAILNPLLASSKNNYQERFLILKKHCYLRKKMYMCVLT